MVREAIFEPLRLVGENTLLYESPSQPSPHQDAPSLVILCTWVGGATPRRIKKYVSRYREIYPTSSILLIRTNVPNMAVRPFRWHRASLQPACDAIRRLLARGIRAGPPDASNGILLHLFSHGGGNVAVQLALSLREQDQDRGAAFRSSLRAVVLDCCPGDDSFDEMYRATKISLPQNTAMQLFANTLLYPGLSVVNGLQHAGVLYGMRDLRAMLNHPALFGADTRRLYIYSKEDVMVGWQAVESHAEEARSRGYQVDQVTYERGAHCGLIMEDADRYWSAVQSVWNGEGSSMASTTKDNSKPRSRL